MVRASAYDYKRLVFDQIVSFDDLLEVRRWKRGVYYGNVDAEMKKRKSCYNGHEGGCKKS